MIVNEFSRPIYNVALNFIADRDMAADITQEIFIRLYENIDKFREEKSFSAWLFAVTRNYCIDYWRKNRKYLQTQEIEEKHSRDEHTPEEAVIRNSEIQKLRRKMLLLDPELRIFLTLRDIEDLSYQEIAEKFRVPLGTVKSRINRARIRLAQLMCAEERVHGM